MSHVRIDSHRRSVRSGPTREPGETITLVLAESFPLLLDGMKSVFESVQGFRVLATCADGDEALRAVKRHHADILVLDLDIRGDAMKVHGQLASSGLPTRTVLMAGALDEGMMLQAVRAGVKGLLLKSMPSHLLLNCVRKVHRGETWIEKVAMGRAVDRLLGEEAWRRDSGGLLTSRELEVVRLLSKGWNNKEIADKLAISDGTVKAHLHHVYEKFGVRGRLELILYVRDKGLLTSVADPLPLSPPQP